VGEGPLREKLRKTSEGEPQVYSIKKTCGSEFEDVQKAVRSVPLHTHSNARQQWPANRLQPPPCLVKCDTAEGYHHHPCLNATQTTTTLPCPHLFHHQGGGQTLLPPHSRLFRHQGGGQLSSLLVHARFVTREGGNPSSLLVHVCFVTR